MSTLSPPSDSPTRSTSREKLDGVVIRFAGDSGDGMQVTGSQFTTTSALVGNDLATLPRLPGRDPRARRHAAGRLGLPGAHRRPRHPHPRRRARRAGGDEPGGAQGQPAAICKPGGVADRQHRRVRRAQPQEGGLSTPNPLEDGTLDGYRRVPGADITTLTKRALEDSGLDARAQERCKNFFALGMCYWLFSRPLEPTVRVAARSSFSQRSPSIADANIKVLQGGLQLLRHHRGSSRPATRCEPAQLAPGTYRNITGNQALALGLVAASRSSGLPLFLGAYPITPA